MDLQNLINDAWELKQKGDKISALEKYNAAFNILTQEAHQFARKATNISPLSNRVTPDLFVESREYLKRDKIACVISNNMGTIFAELGDIESAKKFFEQAIELTPDNEDYVDPKIGLSQL